MNKSVFVLILLFCCLIFDANGQGCSDAGFCTMGAMKPDQGFNKKIQLKAMVLEERVIIKSSSIKESHKSVSNQHQSILTI